MGLSVDRANLAGIQARIGALKARVQDLEIQAGKLASIAPQIAQLERKREIEDANYKYFQASLERARVDEALDPAKMPNISAVQTPSPPMRVTGGLKKKMASLVGGGLAVGIALAFLLELVVDRSVKRPLELTTRLRIPDASLDPLHSIQKTPGVDFASLGASRLGPAVVRAESHCSVGSGALHSTVLRSPKGSSYTVFSSPEHDP